MHQLWYLILAVVGRGNTQFHLPGKEKIAIQAESYLHGMYLHTVELERSVDHPKHGQGWEQRKIGNAFMNSLSLPRHDSNYVIYNASISYVEYVQYMYYRDFDAAFSFPPSDEEIAKAKSYGLVPVCINHPYTKRRCPNREDLTIIEFSDWWNED